MNLLLSSRADPRIQDSLGATCQMLAKTKGFIDVSDHLLQYVFVSIPYLITSNYKLKNVFRYIKIRNKADASPACCSVGSQEILDAALANATSIRSQEILNERNTTHLHSAVL